jgi:hypothetical protein
MSSKACVQGAAVIMANGPVDEEVRFATQFYGDPRQYDVRVSRAFN